MDSVMFEDIMWLVNISQCGLVMEIWVIFPMCLKLCVEHPKISTSLSWYGNHKPSMFLIYIHIISVDIHQQVLEI